MEAKVVLQTEGLTRRFVGPNSGTQNEVIALENINFILHQGEACAVVGPSGSGKSTFLTLAAGLDLPSAGRVLLDGQDLSVLSEDQRAEIRRSSVGFVFQSYQLLPNLTALENVLLPLEISGIHQPERGIELLSRVGLAERLNFYPTQLSGGEQQRVALARAFIHAPKIIFADEPTGSLDAVNAALALDCMFELQKRSNTALLLVTHDLQLAARLERKLLLNKGSACTTP